jgi:hypothetical protein
MCLARCGADEATRGLDRGRGRAGEFCTHAYDSQYRHYGYRCIRFYVNVHRYRLTHA